MRAHVFIVNDETFPIHLKYLFAGTGASYREQESIWVDWHIGLLSDIKRVRSGDFVIFYIEGSRSTNGFYGIFKIANQNPVVFHTPYDSGFQPGLQNKAKLIYRTLLEPFEVYAEGVPEWEVLDKLPIYATQILWSLIYRKLKGKRGCTPLLPWEAELLIDMIRNKNNGKYIANDKFTGGFDWDKKCRRIILTPCRHSYPTQRSYTFNPLEAICYVQTHRKSFDAFYCKQKKFITFPQYLRRNRSYESYLQLYFTENIGIDSKISDIVGYNPIWFGNEVACGIGMQKIDILTICYNNKKNYRIIELKDEPVNENIIEAIEYYVNWASQQAGRHLEDAFAGNIQPVIVAPPHKPKNWQSVAKAFIQYNNKKISLPIEYFEFTVNCGRSINFNKINY
ncbi:MAG: hypothetical protein ABIK10_05285 [candidate division WOR-3 bacterium]